MTFERRFPPRPSELAPARAALRAWLHDVGVDGEDATADVLVVTSELVTNGVLHDGGDLITLRANLQDRDVSIEVTTVDHLPGRRPTYRDVDDSADGGRGLEIVHALSHDYSVVRRDNERVTECQVTTADDVAPVAPADVAPPGPGAEHGSASRPTKTERSQPRTSEWEHSG
jgi:anti-sigma regulatory factor (Ser/Thr protein kinase)